MIRKLALASASALLLVGCGGSGDINVNSTTNDNSVNNSNNTTEGGGDTGDTNPCASYTTMGGTTRQGTYDGTDCTYAPSFVDAGNNLMVDLTIPDLPNNGNHIFQGSLFVGPACSDDQCLADNNITEGGDGPTLTIEAGATLAWQSNANFFTINRGSQIFAVGTAEDPITFTSVSDINGDLADAGEDGAEAVQQWGGMVVDGFAVTNACDYVGERGESGFALDSACHVPNEGSAGLDENFYGGDNDDDSSGRMEFVIVKHTGATVGNGDELNGISFGAVGRNTIVRNLQMYSTFDDGIEMFGGAVNFENFAAVYVRDDSIDIDEGWIGTIDNSIVIQQEFDGNHCIEADGIASFDDLTEAVRDDFVTRGLNSAPTINNLTCIVSPNGADTSTHDPGAGWRLREGLTPTINDAIVVTSFADDADNNGITAGEPTFDPNDEDDDGNYCFRPEDPQTVDAFLNDTAAVTGTIFACEDPFRSDGATVAADEDVQFATIADGPVDPTVAADPDLVILEVGAGADDGTQPIFSVDFGTMLVDGAAPTVTAPTDFLGALSTSETNPYAGWTFGIFADNRSQPLWFE